MRYFYSIFQKTSELLNKFLPSLGIIFTFHNVVESYEDLISKRSGITRKNFELFILNLISNGYTFKALKDLDLFSTKKSIYITFDDVFMNVIQNALPILISNDIPFCLFVTEDYIDKKGYIDSTTLKEIAINPLCTIGFHSKSHPKFRFLNKENYDLETQSKTLSNLVNRDIDFFAFPYGSKYACSNKNVQYLKKTNYKFAFSTYNHNLNAYSLIKKPFFLPRRDINNITYKVWIDKK